MISKFIDGGISALMALGNNVHYIVAVVAVGWCLYVAYRSVKIAKSYMSAPYGFRDAYAQKQADERVIKQHLIDNANLQTVINQHRNNQR